MKICKVCLGSNILCPACNKKRESGQTSDSEIKTARAVHNLSKEIKKEITFEKSLEAGDYIIIVSKVPSLVIGPGGKNAKKLGDALGKKIIVIDVKDDEKTAVRKIINAHVTGINISYGPEKSYKIRVDERERKRVSKDKIKVLENFLSKKVDIIFE